MRHRVGLLSMREVTRWRWEPGLLHDLKTQT